MPGTVGFIGLGAMGGPMALNLVKHGFSLVVHDIDPAKLEPLRARAPRWRDSPADGGGRGRAHDLHGGDHRAGRGGDRGRARHHPHRAGRAHRGVHEHDRPVRRAPPRASSSPSAASRCSMRRSAAAPSGRPRASCRSSCGGAPETFAACRGSLPRDGQERVPCRAGSGQGLAMKLVNNMLVQVNTVAMAEALVLGRQGRARPADDLRRGPRQHRQQLRVREPRAADPAARLRAGRHGRHLVQGPGAGDRVRQAARRAAAARQRDASRSTRWRARPASTRKTAPPSSRCSSSSPA